MERNINRTVIALAVLVGIVTGMTLQQSVLARRAYGSYDLDEDSRQAILHGGGGSASQARAHSSRARRARSQPSGRSSIHSSAYNQTSSPSVSPGPSFTPSTSTNASTGSADKINRVPASFDLKPGGLSPASPIDPPTSYTRP